MEELPMAKAGCLSQMVFGWQTSIMWNIYRKGIDSIQHLGVSNTEKAKPNADRLKVIWEEELQSHGPKQASFARATLRFMKTRVILAAFTIILTDILKFVSPAFVLYQLLKYLEAGDVQLSVGIGLVFAIVVTELGRMTLYSFTWFYNYTTGIRVRAAVQGLLYRKILKLKNLEDKSVGELVNLLSNDGLRIFEAISVGPLILPGPIVLTMGLIYLLFLIGPWSLIAMGTFAAFYLFMLFISKLTTYYRRKCVVITDKRVQMMNELLTCIKLIKMNVWEKSFAKTITAIRSDERKVLEKGAYVQSISTSTSPIVPVMASVFMFVGFVLAGNELTAVKAFTVFAVINSMRFSLENISVAVKVLANANISFKRFKSILMMDEMEPHPWKVFNDKYAVILNKATFRWDKEVTDKIEVNVNSNSEVKSKANKTSDHVTHKEQQKLNATEQTNGNVSFVDTSTLHDITFMVEKGKLIGISGGVASGKSSLLSAILGRMVYVSGEIALDGSMAYVTQQAWITNSTIRENILFGEQYDADRYAAVVDSCSLLDDFNDFVDGDQIEIGERGINLSGGQKQRISLARAVYSDKDIYLLDDPLSAVDIHVGRHIFSECILKQLHGKTVLFVTHQLQYLHRCHKVMFLKDGVVTDIGTHTQMMANDTEYANLIKVYYTKEKEKEASLDNLNSNILSSQIQLSADPGYLIRQRTLSQGSRKRTMSQCSQNSGDGSGLRRNNGDPLCQISVISSRKMNIEDESSPQKGGKLIVEEEKSHGSVGWAVYSEYMKAGGGYLVYFLVLLTFFISIATQTFATWWLSHWLNQGSGNTTIVVNNVTTISGSISDHPDVHFYTTVYGGSVGIMILTTGLRTYLFVKATLRASSTMHNDLLYSIMDSAMQFFDTTPIGRIVNRFSSDLDEIDVRLPTTSEMFIQNLLLILFAMGIIVYVSPWFLLALIPLSICFLVLNVIFIAGVRDLMRMVAITRSPIVSHVAASVQGISTIYAHGKTDRFIEKLDDLIDKNSTFFYLFYCSKRWLAVRLDLISICMVGVTGVCIVLTYDNITPALAGLAMSFAIQMTGFFQLTMRKLIQIEAKFVSVQRLQQYSADVMSEAPALIKDNRPPADWPKEGEIQFDKYAMKYRDDLPLALKGITFMAKQKEKIGIVGRSGSGKSSLGVALFRLVEPAAGSIYIDGIDITKIGLEHLRSHLAIIQQDPVLFIGTVRYNLDPIGHHKDTELWEALEKCHVKDTILSFEFKLDHMVKENGKTFSVGERQLLCMARALLKNSKILVLDEATAAIDTKTDALVQTTIKEAFSDCTMLIIAHRLHTVLDCNKILVMEDGKVVEYGKPEALMASSTSKFKAMMDAVVKQHENI